MKMALSTSVEVTTYLNAEEIAVLNDINSRCYYPSQLERKRFVRDVCASVGVKSFAEITEDDFETAFNAAMGILRERGNKILSGRLQHDNLAKGLYLNAK